MKRILAIFILVFSLAGCYPQVESNLTTPSTKLTYGWVMVHHWSEWGVQEGGKNDGSGLHVAVYAWKNCSTTNCEWEFFKEYDTLAPGSTHTYKIDHGPDGWRMWFDGRLIATLNPGSNEPLIQINLGEKTAA